LCWASSPGQSKQRVLHLFQLREGPFGIFRWTAQDLGGIEVVASILNRSGSTLEREVLVYLDEHDPELAQQIRSKMFSFEDIARLSNQEIQQLLEEVDPSDIAVALKGIDEQIRDRFLSNMSDTGTSTAAVHSKTRVQEEMATSEPVKIFDVENARERIVQEVRRMEQQGKASIVRGDGGIRDTIL